ncbi:MAG: carotenoid oxygenase family protein, partial [Burkholderiaceae bacterium]|nr:carotenoid oxygenase family protein [Burkholderiaceae bacterium]
LCLDIAPVVEDLGIERLRAGTPSEAPRARHTRFVLSPGSSAARQETLPGRFELPQVNMKAALAGPVRYVWAAAAGGAAGDACGSSAFFDRTVKFDHATGRFVEHTYDNAVALEPLYVPAPGATAEDDGVLLVHTLADADAGSIVRVLDAATLDQHAAVELPVVVPFGFHGAWAGS